MDPRHASLAEMLLQYSCEIRPNERVFIDVTDTPDAMTIALVEAAHRLGALPFVSHTSSRVERALLRSSTRRQLETIAEIEAHRMAHADCYIGIRGSENISEHADVPERARRDYMQTVWRRVHREVRVPKTRWVILRWPTPSMAQLAGMSTEAFENYFFEVCIYDYGRLSRAMKPLRELCEATRQVRIVGPGETDLSFSIEDIPAVVLDGRRNVPDGEVLTAPQRESVEGTIVFNCPTIYQGSVHDQVRLRFRGGAVVEAESLSLEDIDEMLACDEGARYVGEFAIGVNPRCTRPIRDVLFDEKIAGSFHLALGNSYDFAFNGNRSDIHWDLVSIQTPEWGGGEMYFDDRLVRKDGLFVHPALESLNPKNLLARG